MNHSLDQKIFKCRLKLCVYGVNGLYLARDTALQNHPSPVTDW